MQYSPTPEELLAFPQYFYTQDGEKYTSPFFLDHLLKEKVITEVDSTFDAKIRKWLSDQEYVIYDYVKDKPALLTDLPKEIVFPEDLNQNLYKSYKLFYGDKVESIYYADFDTTTGELTNPIVKLTYEYHRDTLGYLIYKVRTFHWMRRDGNYGEEVYSDLQPCVGDIAKIKELKLKRANIVEEIQGQSKELGFLPQMLQLYNDFQNQLSLYKDVGTLDFSQTLATTVDPSYAWLDQPTPDNLTTLRQHLSYCFSLGTIQ